MNRVLEEIRTTSTLPPVPLHLRNASTKLGKQLGYGNGYSYNLEEVQNIRYMPDGMENVKYFDKNG